MSEGLEFIRLGPEHVGALTRLFALIAADETSRSFHPHRFDSAEARRICERHGKDQYHALSRAGEFLGYGMLRGWDEGYEVPSLGIYIAPALRGTGAAVRLMQHLHQSAKQAGAQSVRLKVYPENKPALKLYRSLGYAFEDAASSDGQIVGLISLPRR